MMLCKLSLSNIKKSFKDYAIYFTTLILGVCIFYIFNSMDSQTAMLNVTSRQSEIIKLMVEVLSYVSVFVSFILGFLIIYASRFMIKKRNKEFGIYMTLGMSKKKISMILLLETFFIGLISLFVGLGLGIILSQVTSVFIANMFEADMTRFNFVFSQSAMMKTILYFGIIYFIVMVFNTVIVNKNKLINLLQSSKKQESIKIKNPIVCIILFILSIIMLGYAYYMVTGGINDLLTYDVSIILVPILLGIFGTIIFFYSVAGMLLKILSKCHNLYSKKLNTFVFKQVSSKINTMVISISMICIMLFFTLCLLSSAFTIKDYFNHSINKYSPVDFQLIGFYDSDSEINLMEFIDTNSFVKNNTKDITTVNFYISDDFNYGTSLGNYLSDLEKMYSKMMYDNDVLIMGESDYNKYAKVMNMDTIDINEDEYAIVSNYETNIYSEVINRDCIIKILEHDLKPYKTLIDGIMEISANPSNLGFFVVDDSIASTGIKRYKVLVGNYTTKDKDTVNELDQAVFNYTKNYTISKNTKTSIKESSVGLSVTVTFIALYLGIIFLISSSAILALKELSDCIDDKNKYKVLRQIGADETDINKALMKQTIIFFMMPLALAIFHTIFGLKFCSLILNFIGVSSMLNGSIFTFIFLIIIYGLYFIITYLCSKNIIKQRI